MLRNNVISNLIFAEELSFKIAFVHLLVKKLEKNFGADKCKMLSLLCFVKMLSDTRLCQFRMNKMILLITLFI